MARWHPLEDVGVRAPGGGVQPRQLLERLIERQPELFAEPHRLDSAVWVSARLAEVLPLSLAEKQSLLELDAGAARLERVSALLREAATPDS